MFALFPTLKLFIFVLCLRKTYNIYSKNVGRNEMRQRDTSIRKIDTEIKKYDMNFDRDVLKEINYFREGYCPEKLDLKKPKNTSFRNKEYCIQEYMDKFVRKLDIEYVQFSLMRLIIREITYKKSLNIALKRLSRRKKRRIRKKMRQNYAFFSNSKNVESMRDICSIDYDEIDYNDIKFKYNKFLKKYNFNRFNHKSFKYVFIIFVVFIFITTSQY